VSVALALRQLNFTAFLHVPELRPCCRSASRSKKAGRYEELHDVYIVFTSVVNCTLLDMQRAGAAAPGPGRRRATAWCR